MIDSDFVGQLTDAQLELFEQWRDYHLRCFQLMLDMANTLGRISQADDSSVEQIRESAASAYALAKHFLECDKG